VNSSLGSPARRASRYLDPPTSRRAGDVERSSKLRNAILKDFQITRGWTDNELQQRHPDHAPGSVSKRRHDLLVDGEIRDSGRTRFTRWGREAMVWEMVR
jgi:hypothetical protein